MCENSVLPKQQFFRNESQCLISKHASNVQLSVICINVAMEKKDFLSNKKKSLSYPIYFSPQPTKTVHSRQAESAGDRRDYKNYTAYFARGGFPVHITHYEAYFNPCMPLKVFAGFNRVRPFRARTTETSSKFARGEYLE